MNLFKAFGTSQELERNGIDLQYGLNSQGQPIVIKVARAGASNPTYARVAEAKTKPYRRQIQTDTLQRDIVEKITAEIYAEAVVIGWSGVNDENEQPLEFTKENVIMLLTSLPDLFADIKACAENASLFRTQILEEDSKN